MAQPDGRPASLLQALIPILALIVMLAASVYLFGDGSSAGPNQIALFVSAAVAAAIGIYNGHRWEALQRASCTESRSPRARC